MSKQPLDNKTLNKLLKERSKMPLSVIKDFLNNFNYKSPVDGLLLQVLSYCYMTVSNEIYVSMDNINKDDASDPIKEGEVIVKATVAGVEKFAKLYNQAHQCYEI